jgi:predicted NBD/HSP70 family sugar kinase
MGLVLNSLLGGGVRSRAEVSAVTGLNPSTVSSLIADLIDNGLLRETGERQTGAVGRPGRILELDPDGGIAIGLEFSADGLGILALDLARRTRYRAFIRQSNERFPPKEVMRQLAGLAEEALGTFQRPKARVACMLGVPGLIGAGDVLLEAPHLGWHGIPLGEMWRSLSDCPLVLENEARLAAYAEMTEGIARDQSNFAFISGGTGLGSGLVLNRKLFRGAHGFAGEFGHITIEPDGPASAWGARGSVQTLAGERALMELAGLQAEDGEARGDPDWIGRHVAELAREGEPRALSAIAEVGRDLGIAIAIVMNLFDMEAIVLGGYLTHLGAWLAEPIDREIQSRVLSQRWNPIPILFSKMGREAALRGAALQSFETIFQSGDLGTFLDEFTLRESQRR